MTPPPVSLGQINTDALLAQMGALRQEAARVGAQVAPGSIPHEAFRVLVAQIDRGACLITGDPQHFTRVRPDSPGLAARIVSRLGGGIRPCDARLA